jgi:hypothetical protein
MIRLSGSFTATATGESVFLSVPDPYVAFLKRLSVTNGATAPATITIICYNGDAKKTILTLKVAAGGTITLREDELPLEACPTKLALNTDQQPITVDYSVVLE